VDTEQPLIVTKFEEIVRNISNVTIYKALFKAYRESREKGERGMGAFQPQIETNILEILCRLVPLNTGDAIDARVVRNVLKYYPFGDSVKETQDNVQQIIDNGGIRDSAISAILIAIACSAEGQQQLVLHGLIKSRFHHRAPSFGDGRLDDEGAPEEFNLDSSNHPLREAGPRAREESFEEQVLRRRRREAMVFAEGEGPVTREDIIQRQNTGSLRDGANDETPDGIQEAMNALNQHSSEALEEANQRGGTWHRIAPGRWSTVESTGSTAPAARQSWGFGFLPSSWRLA
jgi:hypothetical protein